VAAGRSAEGGALLLLVLPLTAEPTTSSPLPVPAVGLGVHPAGSG